MYTDFTTITWEEAYKSFLIHLKAIRAPKTVYFYDVQLRMLVRFVNEKNLPHRVPAIWRGCATCQLRHCGHNLLAK